MNTISPPAIDPLPRLTVKQDKALGVLLSGGTDEAAAKASGVRRETVNRWRRQSPNFIAEYNRRRREAWQGQRDRLRNDLLPLALDAIEHALQSGSTNVQLRAATQVLQAVGVSTEQFAPRVGPTSVAEVRKQWQRDADHAAQMAVLDGLLSKSALTMS